MNSHALVICPRREDHGLREAMFPPANIRAGKCISCGAICMVNWTGADAIRSRDADVCCIQCEGLYTAEINRSLIES